MSDRVGVMSQGCIPQIAVPRDSCDNPVKGFVASFVGENNIFEGDFISVHGHAARGKRLSAEVKNDGVALVPSVSEKVFASFDAAWALLLPDANVRGEAMKDLIRCYGTELSAMACLLVAFGLRASGSGDPANVSMRFESFYPYLPVAQFGGPKDVFTLQNQEKNLANPIASKL